MSGPKGSGAEWQRTLMLGKGYWTDGQPITFDGAFGLSINIERRRGDSCVRIGVE